MTHGDPKICYISDERFPSRWTDTQQIVKTASALAAEGMNVDLVLPRKWPGTLFAAVEARREILKDAYGVQADFGLTQIPSVPPSRVRLEKLTHGLLAPAWAVLGKHDLIYTRNALPLRLGLSLGKYAIFESHRVLRQHYPVTYRWLRSFRDHPRFLGVVTNAEMIGRSYREMGFEPERVAVVHNSFDPTDLEPRLSQQEARSKLGLPQDVGFVCYAGHIQQRKGIATVIDIAARTPEVRYLICGGYPRDIAAAKKMAHERGARNLQFFGWVDVHKLAPYLFAADILLVPPATAPLQRHGNTVLPIKIYTYLATGRVIVAPRLVDVEEILEHGRNALLVTPDQPAEAAEAIRRALADRELARSLGENARELSRQFTWQARARQIRQFIRERMSAALSQQGERGHSNQSQT